MSEPATHAQPTVAVPLVLTQKAFECSKCHMVFVQRSHATRHLALEPCRDGVLKDVMLGSIKLPEDFESNARQRHGQKLPVVHIPVPAAGTVVTGSHNMVNSIIIVHAGDVVPAGSLQESQLIQKTILENPQLRNMLRTIENAPGAIFHMTKGAAGPPHLRNVRTEGRHVQEDTPNGPVTHTPLTYAKKTAVELVDELQRAVQCVTAADCCEVKAWARDIREELTKAKYRNLTYPEALKLYRDASTKFYTLPDKDAIMEGVDAIRRFATHL